MSLNKNVIINADDFGLSPSVNEAIAICFRKSLIQRCTTMVNMDAYSDGCLLAKQQGFADHVGLHLVLDEGCPLTEEIKTNPHFCRDGVFIKGWFSRFKRKIYLSVKDRKCIKKEVEAQMKRYCESGYSLMHIDSHHLVHTSSPILAILICNLAKKNGFKSMRNGAIYKKDNIVIRIVKKFIMYTIQRNFTTTAFFASLSQYQSDLDDVEYMSHPDIVDGVVVDFENRRANEFHKLED